MEDRILDIFYNNIIKEASSGRVNCYFYYNVVFKTMILEDNIYIDSRCDNDDLIIPTLIIKNRKEFDRLLVDYVKRAIKFYDDSNYEEEVRRSVFDDLEDGICREKVIMTLLWANATLSDFNDPISFFKKRINFLDDEIMVYYSDRRVVGYSNVLGANIGVCAIKNRIGNETPYSFRIFLKDNFDNYLYEFPKVYVGTSNDCAYLYAIQNDKNKIVNETYRKKIDRKLYKINENFDVKGDTCEKYGFGNLKDVTPSFLVAANIIMGILSSNGINRINVSSILIERWNAKNIAFDYRRKKLKEKNNNDDKISSILQEDVLKYLNIQSNLTEKFIRIFRRLDYHHSGINIINYPYEVMDDMVIHIDDYDECNNRLLSETYSLRLNNSYKKK